MPDCGQCQSSEPSVRSCVTKAYSKVALLHSEAGHRDKGKGRCQHLSCLQPTNSYNGKVLKAQAQLGFLVLLLQYTPVALLNGVSFVLYDMPSYHCFNLLCSFSRPSLGSICEVSESRLCLRILPWFPPVDEGAASTLSSKMA